MTLSNALALLGAFALPALNSSCEPSVAVSITTPTSSQRLAAVQQDPAAPAEAEGELHAAFHTLLQRHVRDGRVDYLRWREDDAAALTAYLDRLAKVEVERMPRAEQLAFYINLYNATMIDVILRRIDANYSTAAAEWAVFDEPLVRLGAQKLSLNHLEHEIVRKTFEDARIHVALVCGAVSCPPLLARTYKGDDLDAVLEANMRTFINSGVRNVIEGEVLRLSQLFNWYAEDFGGADGVPRYVARFSEAPIPDDPKVEFLDYDWALNLAAPSSGRWVRLTQPADGLPTGALVEVRSETSETLTVNRPGQDGDAQVPVKATAAWPQ